MLENCRGHTSDDLNKIIVEWIIGKKQEKCKKEWRLDFRMFETNKGNRQEGTIFFFTSWV